MEKTNFYKNDEAISWVAATYLSKYNNDFGGLILLGAYSTSDLSKSNLNVVSIYGNQDKILNMTKY